MKSGKQKRIKAALTAFAASILAGALSSTAMAQNNPVANFDEGYLDQHPDVAQQLSAHPDLVDNPQYMARHPHLQQYLTNHPQVRTDLREHPDAFMHRESQFNANNPGGNGYRGNGANPVGRFDEGYLDQHPDVAHQLASNPSLVDNPQYMAQHPELQQYLANHPQVRTDLKNHPYRFMGAEDHANGWHGPSGGYGHTDSYMDAHPEVAQQLNQNPRLIDNPQYIAQHPELKEYLQNHPNARHAWRSHPYRYMQHERHYDQTH